MTPSPLNSLGRFLSGSLVLLAFLWLVTIRVPTAIWLGGFTLNAYLTGVAALIGGLLSLLTVILIASGRPPHGFPLRDTSRPLLVVSLSAMPLLGYSAISLGLNFRIEGFQNALVWAAFSLALFALPLWIGVNDQKAIASGLRIVVLVVPITKIITFYGGVDFYGEASYALVAVVLMAYAVSQKPSQWFDYAAPWLLLFSILLCDVRTAAVVAGFLILFTAHHLRVRPLVKTLVSAAAGIAAGVLIWIFVGDRFLNRGDAGLAQFVGDDSPLAGIGTTNRAAAWAFILENLPPGTNWWGQGAGHSSYLADELLAIHHPHNEYLRIFFDFGWAGLALFLGSGLALFVALVINWRRTPSALALASVLVVPAVALMAVTDNPIVFVYVMVPVAVIIASSFALQGGESDSTRAQT